MKIIFIFRKIGARSFPVDRLADENPSFLNLLSSQVSSIWRSYSVVNVEL